MIGAAIARASALFDGFASSAVLLREAARTSRRWQTYAARTGFSGALFGVLLLGIWSSVNLPFGDVSDMGWLGYTIFVAFSAVLLLLATGLAPLVTSSALIEETEDRTLEMLILSKLRTDTILAGKVLSRILILITVVFGAMPVMAMVVTLGGVAPQAVVAVTVHTLVTVVWVGTLGAFYALFTRSPMLATGAAASTMLGTSLLLPLGYALSTGHAQDAVHFSPFVSPWAEDWSASLAVLSFLPSLWVVHRLGTRLFELKVSQADIRRAFSAETWSTRTWAIGMGVAAVSGVTVLPLLVVGNYTFRFANSGARGPLQQAGLVATMAGTWLWWTLAFALLTWGLVRVGVDVVDAMDAILSGRGGRARDRSRVHVWRNPVAWREARPASWGANGLPILVTWLLAMLGMFQTGWWVIPGGALAMGAMNTVVSLGLTLWFAARTIDDERRTGSLYVLLTTPFPSWRILFGKALGVAVPTLPLLVLSFPFIAFGVPHLHLLGMGASRSFGDWLLRGTLTWMWTFPLWAVVLTGGMWTALRVNRRSGFGVAIGTLAAVLGLPTVLGRVFSGIPLVAVPSRMIAPPLVGDAELWQFAFAIAAWSAVALGAFTWTSIGLRRWIAAGIAAACMALALPGVASAQPAVERQDDFLIVAEPLGDGLVRSEQWAGVRVAIVNLGANARATIELAEREGTETRSYRRTIDLPQGVRKDAVLLYRPNRSGRERVVELSTPTQRRALAVFRVEAAPDEAATVGVIGEDMLGIQGLRQTWPGPVPGPRPRGWHDEPRPVRSGLIDPGSLALHSAAYQGFDQLVWPAADPSRLAPGQAEALVHWVADGGHLLVTATENWQALVGSPLEPMLPLQLRGTEDRSDLGMLLRSLGGTDVGQVPVGVGTLRQTPDRDVVVRWESDDGVPLLVTGGWGLGSVSVLTLDPRAGALRGNVPSERMWREILLLPQPNQTDATLDQDGVAPLLNAVEPGPSVLTGQQLWTVSEWDEEHARAWEAEIRGWLADIPGVAPLPLSWLLAFSALYLLAIGPVDGLLLRWLGRQPWTWVTFPITIVAFSTFALVTTTWMKGSQAMVSTLEVVDLLPGTRLWRGDAWVGVFATRRTRIATSSQIADAVAEPLLNTGYARDTAIAAGLGPGVFSYSADTWTLAYNRHAWVAPAPGEITVEKTPIGWAVTNGLPFALDDAELHFGTSKRSFAPVGPLSAGQRVEIASGVHQPLPGDQAIERSDALAWLRYRLIDTPSPGRGYLQPDDGQVLVLARAREPITPLAVDGVSPIHRRATVIRAVLTPRTDRSEDTR